MDYDVIKLFILVWGAAFIAGWQLKKGIESIKLNLTIHNLHVPDGRFVVQDDKFELIKQRKDK